MMMRDYTSDGGDEIKYGAYGARTSLQGAGTTAGRWLTPDPKSEDYYGVSPYSYCAGDPVNFVDQDGYVGNSSGTIFILRYY